MLHDCASRLTIKLRPTQHALQQIDTLLKLSAEPVGVKSRVMESILSL